MTPLFAFAPNRRVQPPHCYRTSDWASEISELSFAKASSLRHITRLALGSLAGIAFSWLFSPDAVASQLKYEPVWVFAFITGYGIELVFAFMDRIIGAFTTKTN